MLGSIQVERDRGYRGPGRDRRTLLRAGRSRPRAGGTTAPVEFTADGKLKQPVGYRKWVYVGELDYSQRPQRRRGPVPRVPLRLHGPRELRRVREDRQVPGRHRPG